MDKVKYTIHFGEVASFRVHKWFYKYFNKVKNNPDEYYKLYQFMINMTKRGKLLGLKCVRTK